MQTSIPILHRSEAIAVVDKPSGLAVHRGWARDDDYAMTRARDSLGQYVYPVHRLDRATSGLLVFALDKSSASAVQSQFAQGEVQKIYLALVRGHPPPSGIIDHPLRKEGQSQTKEAQTKYFSLATWERYAWVLASPQQGRQHQIRRHFKHISCHLIGDVRYGKGEHNRYARQALGLHRLALHAIYLRLHDPAAAQGSSLGLSCLPSGSLASALGQWLSIAELRRQLGRAQEFWRE